MHKKNNEPINKFLLKKQHANLTRPLIVENGLNPDDFDWKTHLSIFTPNMEVSRLVHKPTGFYFSFDYFQLDYFGKRPKRWSVRSPGWHEVVDDRPDGSWESQQVFFNDWLDLLRQELNTPDIWSSVEQGKDLFAYHPTSNESNTPFTKEEQKTITNRLSELQFQLLEFIESEGSTSAENLKSIRKIVKEQFDYLSDAASRISRVDWKNLALNSIVTIVVTAAFAPDARQVIFQFLMAAFRELLRSQNLLP